jgi:glycine betaine/choline ABC-type transport system substrate-binding protein
MKFRILFWFAAGCILAGSFLIGCSAPGEDSIRIGSKNFTEQFIMAEVLAQLIEKNTDLKVDRVFNLGGTMICHNALVNGEIDMYPEYTGTGLTAILGRAPVHDANRALRLVTGIYREKFQLQWLSPFGFNNTYAITVRRRDAAARNWRTISDLKPTAANLVAGFTAEFAERTDGYPGLKETYGFAFSATHDMDPGLMYKAIADGQVDVICAFSTDGRIKAYGLQLLKDDKGFFPPYFAAPVVRSDTLEKHPEIEKLLRKLAGLIDNDTMQQLNYAVDEKKRTPEEVAGQFLLHHGLVSK